MIEDIDIEKSAKPRIDFGPVEDMSQNIIKVIGVGGGGQNAVRNMYDEGIEGVTFAVCNTDSAALSKSPVPVKIQFGPGLGAGAKPEIGRKEAESSIKDIERLLDDGTKMVFVTAGMGGGTGTGAAPVVAKVAKDKGILTVGVVTIPFYFEQKRKIVKALRGVDELRKQVDAMLIVNNERICDIYNDTNVTLKDAFKRADSILKDAVKGISELITISSDGSINLDFRDVETTMRNGGGAIMAIGRASGDRRVERAIIDALDSPLLFGNDIGKAKRILFNIYASPEHPFFVPELSEISEFFDQLDPNIDVIWGTAEDPTLGEDAKVIILATDMDNGFEENELWAEEHGTRKNDAYYASLIPRLYASYKPATQPMAAAQPTNVAQQEQPDTPPLVVELPENPEPAMAESTEPAVAESAESAVAESIEPAMAESAEPAVAESDDREERHEPPAAPHPVTMVERWKRWLEKKISNVMEDPEE